jgi:hypothetical protein
VAPKLDTGLEPKAGDGGFLPSWLMNVGPGEPLSRSAARGSFPAVNKSWRAAELLEFS